MKTSNYLHLIVTKPEDVEKLKFFCNHSVVLRSAYAFHSAIGNKRSHWHFVFMMKYFYNAEHYSKMIGISILDSDLVHSFYEHKDYLISTTNRNDVLVVDGKQI